MQRLVFSWQHLAVFPADLPFLDGTFPPDHDFGAAFLFDVLQSVAAGNNREGKSEHGGLNASLGTKVKSSSTSKSGSPWPN